jgi:hypothetical protein
MLKNGTAAAAEFRTITDHGGEVPVAALYPLAHLGLARAAALTNDTASARKAYDDFFSAWKDADPSLRLVAEARLERARLP